MSEEIPGLETSAELVTLSQWVEVAFDLADKMRSIVLCGGEVTAVDGYRMADACEAIGEILGVSSRDVWADYVESKWCPDCGHGCACGGAK